MPDYPFQSQSALEAAQTAQASAERIAVAAQAHAEAVAGVAQAAQAHAEIVAAFETKSNRCLFWHP